MIRDQITTIDLPLQGMHQLSTILDIVKNKETYTKRLKGIETQRDKLIELIETLGLVKEIEDIKNQVVNERDTVLAEIKVLQDKKEKADDVITQAHKSARTIELAALERASNQKTNLDRLEKELAEKRKQLGERERVVQLAEVKATQSQEKIDTELKHLDNLKRVAESARLDFENRQAKLEKAISGI